MIEQRLNLSCFADDAAFASAFHAECAAAALPDVLAVTTSSGDPDAVDHVVLYLDAEEPLDAAQCDALFQVVVGHDAAASELAAGKAELATMPAARRRRLARRTAVVLFGLSVAAVGMLCVWLLLA